MAGLNLQTQTKKHMNTDTQYIPQYEAEPIHGVRQINYHVMLGDLLGSSVYLLITLDGPQDNLSPCQKAAIEDFKETIAGIRAVLEKREETT
jgi:hypothetical protein